MPIYMDRHDISASVTAENVAQLHQQDLKIQEDYCCRGMTYWFDGERHTAFCLIEAPSKDAVIEMHQQAHGDVPNTIIEVDEALVEAFLGRITDPEPASKSGVNIIDDPAFRTLVFTCIEDPVLLKHRLGPSGQDSLLALYLNSIRDACGGAGGHVARLDHGQFTLAFTSASRAVRCAEDIRKRLSERESEIPGLKICVHADNPVSGSDRLFGAATDLAGYLFHISEPGGITITEKVADLAGYVRLEGDPADVTRLSASDEKMVRKLFGALKDNLHNETFSVDDLGAAMLMSKSSLNRLTRSLTGRSPNNLIKTFRLDAALRLLRLAEAGIGEISFETGFASPSYFSKCFKQHFGISPSEYQAEAVN